MMETLEFREVYRALERLMQRLTSKIRIYGDVLQNEVKQFLAKMLFQQGLARWYTSNIAKKKIDKLKLRILD